MKDIVSLPKEQYQGFRIPVQYVTWEHLRVDQDEVGGTTEIRLVPTRFEAPRNKSYEMEFYPPYYEHAEAYGVFDKKDLIAALEVNEETWNKRLRVTELWVDEAYRRKGLGGQMLEFAKDKTVEKKCRMAILETQTCNLAAIELYRKHGFTFIGLDTTCYSNDDVEKDEVRVEMGWKTGVAG